MARIKPKSPQKYICTICGNRYTSIHLLANHTKKEHDELIGDEYEHVEQFLFDMRNPNSTHICPICKKNKVKWNQSILRYNRFCDDPKTKCREKAGKIAKENMLKKYGKKHLLDDPEMQKKMLEARSIAGSYTFSDKKTKITYVGSYEKDFLEFYDTMLKLDPEDIMDCDIIFNYKYEKENKFYMPDFYIPSLNLIIEIKDGGDNPNLHPKIQKIDKEKEKLKDEAVVKSNSYNYIKIVNKEYSEFVALLSVLKNETEESKDYYFIIPE